jgi:hypothetical protein
VLHHNGEIKRLHHDHQEIDQRLGKVHSAKTCAEARRLLKTAIVASREHFRGEEKSIFPYLEKALQADTLNDLGRAWLRRQTSR